MVMKGCVFAGVVLLLAACSPPPLSVPSAAGSSGAPNQAATFLDDAQVKRLASCASAALETGESDAWKQRVEKLRVLHRQMHPGQEASAVESDAIKAVFDAKARFKQDGITTEGQAAYLSQHCVGL